MDSLPIYFLARKNVTFTNINNKLILKYNKQYSGIYKGKGIWGSELSKIKISQKLIY